MTRSIADGSLYQGFGSAPRDHGGDLSAAARRFPQAPKPWLDLSTGINPRSYPIPELGAEVFARLPDPDALLALEEAARLAYCVPDDCQVVATPGTQAIIGMIPRLWPARRVGILGFTYSEHERAWNGAGARVTIVEQLAELRSADAAVVVNPNNPDGRLIAAEDLGALARSLTEHGGLLVVDEAFCDFLEPSASLVPVMPRSGALVLRSFGKTFGLPGLRLGFAVTSAAIAERLRAVLGPWPVSGAAIEIGKKALVDTAWLAASRERLRVDSATLDAILDTAGFGPSGGTPMFRLVEHADAAQKFEALGRAGILVRRFESRPTWLRFGIPGDDPSRARLRAAIASN